MRHGSALLFATTLTACFGDFPYPAVTPLPDGATDVGPQADASRPDSAAQDAGGPAGTPADAGPDAAPIDQAPPVDGSLADRGTPCAVDEICNGLDDDCDGQADEGVDRCYDPDAPGARPCRWRHRGHHGYLFCDRPVPEAEALDICARQYGLEMAIPETCDESDWLWATGNLVPSPVNWDAGARGRAWWLGLRLNVPDDGESLVRSDGREVPLPESGCWSAGEPDDDLLGETCVSLTYSPTTDDFGWNDESCGFNAANPMGVLCEVPCDPALDADGDGENACVDCDDRDPDANGGDGIDRCPLPPAAGFPP